MYNTPEPHDESGYPRRIRLSGIDEDPPSVSAFVNHSLATLSVSSREKTSAGSV